MTFISSTTRNPNFTSSVLEKHYADKQEKSLSCDSGALQHHQLFKLVLRSIKCYLFKWSYVSTETSVSVSLGCVRLHFTNVITCSVKGMKAPDLGLYHFISQLTIQWWMEGNEMSKTEGPWWEQLPECMTLFPLNHYISFLLPVSRSPNTE